MRLLILFALCLAVASANYGNRNQFNRLLRNLHRQQQLNQHYESQGLSNERDYDQQDDYYNQEDDDDYNQQQCSRRGNLDLDDQDDEQGQYEHDQDNDDQDQNGECYPGQSPRQCRQQQQRRRQHQQQQYGPFNQQKRQQQRHHQCQPKHQLLQELEEPNSKLASKLYKQAKQENDDKNTVVSPAAVQLALAALQRGARGNTKKQLQRLLGDHLSQKQQQQAHAALQETLQGRGQRQQQHRGEQNQQAQVKTTTTIIVNQRTRAQQKFIQSVKACVNAQVKQCNFQRQPQQCRQQINQYLAQKTDQKLQQVVPQEAVTENTKLIVVSTAQIKARWGRQFRQQQTTKQGKFYPLGCQQPKPVQVLQSQGQFNYYEDEQLQIVGVPTKRQELTLYLIVPKEKDGLNELEKEQIQNGQQLKQLLDQAEQQREQIDLELPKFQIKHKIDAKHALRQQGAQAPFDADEADLSGINGQQQQQRRRRQQQFRDSDEEEQQNQYDQDEQQQQQRGQQLHVNKLIHQATIKIDEQGINAARPGRQHQQYQPYQNQDQDDQEDQQDQDDQEDQQQEIYEQQQYNRRQLHQEIFDQGQRRHQQYQRGESELKVKVNRAFAFAIKHNPSNQIVLVGRVVDATQKPKQQQPYGRQQGQSLYGVDQQ